MPRAVRVISARRKLVDRILATMAGGPPTDKEIDFIEDALAEYEESLINKITARLVEIGRRRIASDNQTKGDCSG